MVHDTNSEAAQIIAEKKKLQDQFIQFSEFKILDLPVDPYTPYFKTNNFFQRSFAHMLAFDAISKRFRLVLSDADGNLKVTSTVTSNLYVNVNGTATAVSGTSEGAISVDITKRNSEVINIFTDESLSANSLATHVGVEISNYVERTVLVSTTQSTTLHFQFSDDNIEWYDYVNSSGTAITLACNATKKAFALEDFTKYLRILVRNESASANVINLKLLIGG